MSISIGPAPILDDLILWYDAASYKCYSGEPTTNQLSQDYVGESGVATGDASINLSGLFGLGLISQRPWSHEVWSKDNINKGKLTRYGAYYFDGVNDYLEIPDDDKFSFGQDNVSAYTSDFSAGVDGWIANQGTADGNIDSIGPGGDLRDDNLRYTIDAGLGTNHYLNKNSVFVDGKYYKLTFDYYMPSTNSEMDGFRIGTTGDSTLFGSVTTATTNAWTSVSYEATASNTNLLIYMTDGGLTTINETGGDDVLYIRNVQITEIKDDLPFSISAWVRMEDATNFSIVSKFGGATLEWVFYVRSTDQLTILLSSSAGVYQAISHTSTLTAREGDWIHVACTFGGAGPNSSSPFTSAASEMALFVDGVPVSVTDISTGTYLGQSNTSKPVEIGRYNNSNYSKGHIKNVKIFNRELNAGEVYQLYYSNSLNGVVYSSDFSEGVDGWSVSNTSISGNIDSIGSKDDNLRITCNSGSSSHFIISPQNQIEGKKYRVSFDYYLPSGQSNVDGFKVNFKNNSASTFIISETSATTDSWTNISGEGIATDYKKLVIWLSDGGSLFFQDAGGDDLLYIRNINIVELDNQSLVDFADEWGGANGGVYTSDFSAGTDSHSAAGGSIAGNIDSIGGENNTLRLTIDSSTGNHQILRSMTSFTTVGKRYRFDADVYIPSTNTNVNGIEFNSDGTSNVNVIDSTTTTDAWVHLSGELIRSYVEYRFRMKSSGSYVFTGNGTDVIYIKNVKITQVGILADFDLANYDDNDKITDRSSNKFVASPQGGALARDRWFAHDLSFSKDTDNNDIATITRNPASGAFYENSNSLTLFGEHPLYITNASTGDKVSVSLQVKSNQTGLFTGINFFNSGTSAHESVLLGRVILPDEYEYIYGTSNSIATGDNVGFELLMNRDFSSGWNYINLKKPQIELKDHATNYVSLTRSGTNAIVNLANRNLYTGTIVNDVKSSGVAKIDGVQAYYPLSGGYWEFNGVDTSISSSFYSSTLSKDFTFESVFLMNDVTSEMVCGFNSNRPLIHIVAGRARFSIVDVAGQIDVDSVSTISVGQKYHIAAIVNGTNNTGELYLNGQFEKGFSFTKHTPTFGFLSIGDRNYVSPSIPIDGRIYSFKIYNGKALTSQEINHNYRSIKTKYGL